MTKASYVSKNLPAETEKSKMMRQHNNDEKSEHTRPNAPVCISHNK